MVLLITVAFAASAVAQTAPAPPSASTTAVSTTAASTTAASTTSAPITAAPAATGALPSPDPLSAPPAPGTVNPRPKIGLVLSGGGARGLSHIGVLKVLEELRVPVDYIAATSMGAIVGGLYASGMSPAEMEKQLLEISWPTLLSDSPPRQDLPFRRKEQEAQFPFSFEIGIRDGEVRAFKGALSGSNLELYLHELTRNVDDVTSFDDLPVPFRAVATDMVSGQEVVFASGPLYRAMRASMSVPGMFAPAEIDGRIFGDGGLVKNLPVDVVRAMGADIVIAVNIGTPLMSRDQLSSVIGFASQTLNILTEQNVRDQLRLLRPGDILISPNLGDLTFIDFSEGPEFISLGEAAARKMTQRLASLAESESAYAEYQARMLMPVDRPPATLDFVRIEGTHFANPEVLKDQMQTQPGKPFRQSVLDKDLTLMYGRGDFENIDYRLVQDRNQNGLIIDVSEKSWGPNYLRFGLQLSSDLQGESSFNILVGHKRAWVNRWGAEWINEVEVGRTMRLATEFYQPLNFRNAVFVSAYGLLQRNPEYIFDGSRRIAEYEVFTGQGGLDIGMPFATSGELRIGYQGAYIRGEPDIAVREAPDVESWENGVRLLARWDTLDHPFFARSGERATLNVFGGHRRQQLSDPRFTSSDYGVQGQVDVSKAFNLSRDGFMHVGLRAGTVSGFQDSLIQDFSLGGFLNLSGLRISQLSGSQLAFSRVVYYHRVAQMPIIGGAVFVGGSLEAGNTWWQRSEVSLGDLRTAGSLFVAADTWVGPFYFAYGQANKGDWSFYLYLGRP